MWLGVRPRPEGLLYALLKAAGQDRPDVGWPKRPTEIRLHPGMAEDFKRKRDGCTDGPSPPLGGGHTATSF